MALSPEDLSLIDQVSSQQMGVDPTIAPPAAAPQAAPAQKQEAPPTATEKAVAANSPNTESTASKAEPFEFFEVDVNGRKEMMTPSQIRGIVPRYQEMNYRHQTEIAPIKSSVAYLNQLRAQLQQDGETVSDEDLAAIVQQAINAFAHNPTMGNTGTPAPASTPGRKDIPVQNGVGNTNGADMESAMSQWEQENAVSLPPMYKEALGQNAEMRNQLAEMKQLLTQMAQNSNQVSTAAEGQLNDAKTQRSQAGIQQIQNNLQSLQNKYQFPDDAEQQFMTFVQERGYMLEDLMDMTLAEKLGSDFKAVLQSPEIDRLRSIAERRQAFTGTASPSPSGGGAAGTPAPSQDQAFFDAATAEGKQKRNLM